MLGIEIFYGEDENDQVQVDGKSILNYTLSHPDYPQLSQSLRTQLETKKKAINPAIVIEVAISGTDWVPYQPATWLDPEEGGYYEDFEIDDVTDTGDSNILDAFTDSYTLSGGDDVILKKMFAGKKLIPIPESFNDFFKEIILDQQGNFNVILKDDLKDYLPEGEVNSELADQADNYRYNGDDDYDECWDCDRW